MWDSVDKGGKDIQWGKDSLFKNEIRPPSYTAHKNKLNME